MSAIKTLVVREFLQDVFEHSQGLEKTPLEPFLELFDAEYQRTVQRELLRLTGMPQGVTEALAEIRGPMDLPGPGLTPTLASASLGSGGDSVHE